MQNKMHKTEILKMQFKAATNLDYPKNSELNCKFSFDIQSAMKWKIVKFQMHLKRVQFIAINHTNAEINCI